VNVARQAPVRIAALLALGCAAPAAAQLSETGAPVRPPGWSLTPAVGVSQMWDDNPTLASQGDVRPGDFVTSVRPSLALGFRGKRTVLRTNYNGSFDYYNKLREQDTQDHRADVDLTHRLTRRVEVFVRDQAMLSPTTADALELEPTTLRRQTTRMNVFRGGFDAALGARTTLNAMYATQWIDFASDDALVPAPLLQGGYSHGGIGGLRHRMTHRWTIGADYDLQRATVGGGAETFAVQSALGVTEFALSRAFTASFGYGHAWLDAGDEAGRRDGAAFNAGLSWSARRIGGTIGYRRAFLPSFGFGGTFQNEELRATLAAQLARYVRWSGGLALSDNDPLRPGDPTLRAISAQTSLGVVVKRFMRFEVFGLHVFQDSGLAGGRVHRTRAGVQATVAGTMRSR
jgi:hypothetical protein